MERKELKSPFPYFGGKSKVARVVWEAFGDVSNYIEPFAGSLAVLLSRPTEPKIETVNDIDGLLVNFWRALKHDPEGVIKYADYPATEIDYQARHKWLISQKPQVKQLLLKDPEAYSTKVAGWWLWGISLHIGSGFGHKLQNSIIELKEHGRGVHSKTFDFNSLIELSKRLRRVRIASGHFLRVLSPAVTTRSHPVAGDTAIFLDPPYDYAKASKVYEHNKSSTAWQAKQWAIKNGNNPLFKIALCGYDLDDMPKGWYKYRWKGAKNLSNNDNREREVIYFNQHCNIIDSFERSYDE